MLSKSYRRKRPRNRAGMRERLDYLRSIRTQDFLHSTGLEDRGPVVPNPKPEVVKRCSILLKPNPCRRKTMASSSLSPIQVDDTTVLRAYDDELLSPTSNHCPNTAHGSECTLSPESLDSGFFPSSAGNSSEDTDADAMTDKPFPRGLFRDPWSSFPISPWSESARLEHVRDRHRERIELLREHCPSRSSSFLSDVASLIDGLSLRSSVSLSRTGSRCLSIVVSSEDEDFPEQQQAAQTQTPSTSALLSSSITASAWSANTSTWHPAPTSLSFPAPNTASPAAITSSFSEPSPSSDFLSSFPTDSPTLANRELLLTCCRHTCSCIHRRITALLNHPSPVQDQTPFTCTPNEASFLDRLGNTTLHVAARWGAPLPVLLRIASLSRIPASAANHSGETFLHVLDPSGLGRSELRQLVGWLSVEGKLGVEDFARADHRGRTFVERLLERSGETFGLESLEAVLRALPGPARVAIVRGLVTREGFGRAVAERLELEYRTAEWVAAYGEYLIGRYGIL
ncbi:uncharacterized protein CTHT_0003140 [Thermochaetoides thermophila DSM 1495]|uniref:Uncharacterized protein n=1 Tax=Chaetomium thermophilum (strain DSM 1495 / CBS 144.50 / IMI 039719) TaxID=759272 RepID=G0RZJ1_CHATD|nr:hypothetical protein CTHT_0003140 [Thermochaetoides thermophila DSM 1495]EGS23619.1 hypothetical protein CTHT_0003140 [Thermochaetoides thermophila DSM 1495]